MANRNDYNYYKNEYGKYKANYYSPGSEEYKKRESGSRKQKAVRIFRGFLVFIVIASIVVGLIFGIIKLSAMIHGRITGEDETTSITVETTTESKTNKDDSKFKKGTKCVVETEEGTGVNLRNKPTYDVAGYQLVPDGEVIIVAEISEDGEWCKTSNFSKNGWLNVKYLRIVDGETNTEEITEEKETTTKPEETTEKPTEKPTEGKTDGSIKTYADAVKAFKEKGDGAVMNCKIAGNSSVFATAKPDANSVKILLLVPGEQIKVVAVSGEYSKIVKSGYESSITWVPNDCLTFVSWG